MANQNSSTAESAPKKGFLKLGSHWPWIIVGMLVFHASIIIGTIVVISARHDLHVESDYYAKSIDWDNQREISENAERMGWRIALEAEQSLTSNGSIDAANRMMQVSFFDANNEPIDGASVLIECYHPGHSDDLVNLVLLSEGEGIYRRTMEMNTPGIWHVNFTIRYQGVHATLSREIEIN